MLFFTSDGDLKRKNSRTAAPFWPQRDLSVVGSRVDASGQRSIERNLIPCSFCSGENHSCQCPMSSFEEKRERYWSTVAPENEEHLGPENWVHYAQELRFFFLKGLLSGAINSILGTMISLAFSIFLDMKISGVTLLGGMADGRSDGTEWWNTWNILKCGIYGIL